MNKTHQFYQHWVPNLSDLFIGSYPSEHAWITNKFGNPCSFLGAPYINNCGFDAAGSMLQHIYTQPLNKPTANYTGQFLMFSQRLYTPAFVVPHEISLGDTGYIYLPTSCANNETCRLHIAFHGCQQDMETVGESFVRNSGLDEWADTNHIVIVYPQVRKSPDVPYNPQGCWDWWGYSGVNYAIRAAPQLATVTNIINGLMGMDKAY